MDEHQRDTDEQTKETRKVRNYRTGRKSCGIARNIATFVSKAMPTTMYTGATS